MWRKIGHMALMTWISACFVCGLLTAIVIVSNAPARGDWYAARQYLVPDSMGRGNVYYVHSGTGSDTNSGRNALAPLATVDAAIGKCTADHGDVIYVMQGHSETLSTATSLVCDVAGVSIIGLGAGPQRPLLIYTAAAAKIRPTATNVAIKNLRLYSNFEGGVGAGLDVTGTADGLTLEDLEFTEAGATKEFLIGIYMGAGTTDVVIRNCRYLGTDGGSTTSIIEAGGAADRLRLIGNLLRGDCEAAAVKLDGAASVDMHIVGNHVVNIDADAGLGIVMHADSTGFADNNMVVNLKDTVVGITGAKMYYGRNYYSNAVNKSCRLVPAEDS